MGCVSSKNDNYVPAPTNKSKVIRSKSKTKRTAKNNMSRFEFDSVDP